MIRVNRCRYWCVPWHLQKGVSCPTSTISLIQRQSSWLYSHMSQYISLRRRRLWFESTVRYQGRLECLNLQLGRERLYVSFWLCDATRIPKETIGIELKPVRTIENWKLIKIFGAFKNNPIDMVLSSNWQRIAALQAANSGSSPDGTTIDLV